MRVATDVGGTFTDYVTFESGELRAYKTLTTPDPSTGILGQFKGNELSEFSHGTTVAVNAVLERKGAPLVFFTTKGFRDLVDIGRQARIEVYSFICSKPKVPVAQVVEVTEHTTKDGAILEKVSKQEIAEAAQKYTSEHKAAVVGFINSYANPENETIAAEVLAEHFPMVFSSHQVRREIREYERFCTAIIEGYCEPLVNRYLKDLESLSKQYYIMQSNGGKAEVRYHRAVSMIMSGPAGGVAAAQALCSKLGIGNAIAYDMGGTSVDVSAIVAGEPQFTDTVQITNIPIKTLAMDIESIGAGGGSIAWVDDGGALKVGPMSAGSHPGPACYNQGGNKFTVSDANLILGVLGNSISEIALDINRAEEAAEPLCQALGKGLQELSDGVRQIVNNNMVSAIKRISIGKGYDPREFTLVAFGGAGPMHASAIADALGIKRIIIPPFAGAFSAFGIMSAPIRTDYVRTILGPLDKALDTIPAVLEEFNIDLTDKLGEQFQNALCRLSMDMRYFGQGHEINIPLSDEISQKNIQAIAEAFQNRHRTLFGFDIIDNPIEVVNIKMVAELPTKEIPLRQFQNCSLKKRGFRDVYPEKDVSIYRRDFHGAQITGPCIIEDDTTTVNVPSSWQVDLDLNDILKMERE